MSRSLLCLALLVLIVCGLAPVAVMFGRIGAEDLQGVLVPRTVELLGRTLLLGCGAALTAVVLGAPFGWLVARSDVPGAWLLRPLGVVPLVLPPLFLAITWTALVDLRGAWMAVLLLGGNTFPLVALFTAKAAERVDARREEAAALVGGPRAVLAMQLPLLLPAIACGTCLAFVFAVNDFSVPDYVSSVGPKFNVYADEVFSSWRGDSSPGRAVAAALPLIALTLLTLLPALALRRRGALATVDTDFVAPQPLGLGRWRWPAFAFCALAVSLFAVVPIGRFVWEAGGGPRGWTAAAFQAAFGRALELARENLARSLLYSALAATLCVPVALVIGHALERARRGRWLEPLSVLPLAVPAVLFGIGNIALWNNDWTYPLYDGDAMIVVLFVGRFLAFPILVASGAVAALDRGLEEAAALSGAGPIRRLAAVVAPSLGGSLLGGWVLVFVLALRELDAAILVPAANGTVMFRAFNAVHFGRDDFVAALCLLVIFFLLLPGLCWTLFSRRRLEVLP